MESKRATKRRSLFPSHLQEDAQRLYNELWGKPADARYFIAPTPVSLERRHFADTPLSDTHVAAEKNDGERHMLLIGAPEDAGESTYAVLVPRSRTLKHLGKADATFKMRFQQYTRTVSLADGTLLDGELMPSGQFVIFDGVAIGGYSIAQFSFMERLKCAQHILSHLNQCTNLPPCRVKTFHDTNQIETILSTSTQADGLIFMPRNTPVQTGRHETMFKWKPVHTCSIDLEWDGTRFVAVDSHGKKTPPEGVVVEVPTSGLVRMGIYELYPTDKKTWRVGDVRGDKVQPNHTETVRRTQITIEDNILPSEIQ